MNNEVNLNPGIGERAVIMGMTGSGKTVLAEQLLKHRRFVVVHDFKHSPSISKWNGYKQYTKLSDLIRAKEEKLIYTPDHTEIENEEIINAFFRWIFERRNTTLYVDEVYGVCPNGRAPFYYNSCIVQGRELGISVFSSTQRPKRIPQTVLSESDNYYVFRLLLPDDRDKVKGILPFDEKLLTSIKTHRFWYGRANGRIIGPCYLDLNSGKLINK